MTYLATQLQSMERLPSLQVAIVSRTKHVFYFKSRSSKHLLELCSGSPDGPAWAAQSAPVPVPAGPGEERQCAQHSQGDTYEQSTSYFSKRL